MTSPNLKSIGVLNRHPANPILTSSDVPYPCGLLFNAGVCKWQGKYVMVFRNDYGPTNAAEFRSRADQDQARFDGTNLGLAYSDDGVNWTVAPEPTITLEKAFDLFAPMATNKNSRETLHRFYDPRLTVCDGRVYMCFAVDTLNGLRGGIATTDDFEHWEVLSLSVPDNRNMVLFPEKVGGRFVRLERPVNCWGGLSLEGPNAQMWMSYSPDLQHWGFSHHLLSSYDIDWANDKMGPGAPPIKTDKGWLTTFHGVWKDDTKPNTEGWEYSWPKIYSAGLMLLDLDNPAKIIARCKSPLLAPEAWYENGVGAPEPSFGFRRNVIFPGGMLLEDDGEVKIYYGASDTVECLATAHVDDLLKAVLENK